MKMCIFNDKKPCDNCGECEVCIFDKKKQCNNCGKCLEMEGYDVRAIKIDEVFEKKDEAEILEDEIKLDLEDFSDFDLDEDQELNDYDEESVSDEPYIDAMDNEDNWEYLDDVEGLDELLQEDHSSDDIVEKFPGLYVYKTHRK